MEEKQDYVGEVWSMREKLRVRGETWRKSVVCANKIGIGNAAVAFGSQNPKKVQLAHSRFAVLTVVKTLN